MSYTAEDALLNIFRDIKHNLGIGAIKDELIHYFEKENTHPTTGGCYKEEIKFLKGGLDD